MKAVGPRALRAPPLFRAIYFVVLILLFSRTAVEGVPSEAPEGWWGRPSPRGRGRGSGRGVRVQVRVPGWADLCAGLAAGSPERLWTGSPDLRAPAPGASRFIADWRSGSRLRALRRLSVGPAAPTSPRCSPTPEVGLAGRRLASFAEVTGGGRMRSVSR